MKKDMVPKQKYNTSKAYINNLFIGSEK